MDSLCEASQLTPWTLTLKSGLWKWSMPIKKTPSSKYIMTVLGEQKWHPTQLLRRKLQNTWTEENSLAKVMKVKLKRRNLITLIPKHEILRRAIRSNILKSCGFYRLVPKTNPRNQFRRVWSSNIPYTIPILNSRRFNFKINWNIKTGQNWYKQHKKNPKM